MFLKAFGYLLVCCVFVFAGVFRDLRSLTLWLEFMFLLVGIALTVIDKFTGEIENEN